MKNSKMKTIVTNPKDKQTLLRDTNKALTVKTNVKGGGSDMFLKHD